MNDCKHQTLRVDPLQSGGHPSHIFYVIRCQDSNCGYIAGVAPKDESAIQLQAIVARLDQINTNIATAVRR